MKWRRRAPPLQIKKPRPIGTAQAKLAMSTTSPTLDHGEFVWIDIVAPIGQVTFQLPTSLALVGGALLPVTANILTVPATHVNGVELADNSVACWRA